MENQDKLFEQFKKAAENQVPKDFPGMEKVWSRVDAKLDTQIFKTQKKNNTNWKKFAVAASLAVGSMFAFQLWKQFEVNEKTIQNSVVEASKPNINSKITIDSIQNTSDIAFTIDNDTNQKIVHQQIQSANQVTISKNNLIVKDSIKIRSIASPILEEEKTNFIKPKTYEAISIKNAKAESNNSISKEVISKSVAKKAPPLIIVDGKVAGKKVTDDLETIVELKEPLYIINGKEYSEIEVFGPNPTSPYYPLHKQEIESISIYQNQEAIDLYGEKGNKGVVVIKTKNGRPATIQDK